MWVPGGLVEQAFDLKNSVSDAVARGDVAGFIGVMDNTAKTFVPYYKLLLRSMESLQGVNKVKPFVDAYDSFMGNEFPSYQQREIEFNVWQHAVSGGGYYDKDYYFKEDRHGEEKRRKDTGGTIIKERKSKRRSSKKTGGRKKTRRGGARY